MKRELSPTGSSAPPQAVATTTSNEHGFYRVLNLPTGMYTFSAKLDGFATAEQKDVRLILGSTPTVNFNLQPTTVAETLRPLGWGGVGTLLARPVTPDPA